MDNQTINRIEKIRKTKRTEEIIKTVLKITIKIATINIQGFNKEKIRTKRLIR